ncbi:MAG: NAD-dependent epimerase/dehydratase family protein [Nitrospirae bacterium]|nr:MAG: NAD-dependent epimerase/dehydratase family protein [Nitrospirota bacterium]
MSHNPILVTGATGFIGSAVVRALLRAGLPVRVLIRRCSDLGNLAGLTVEHAYGDLLDPDSLRAAMRGCRYLYHVAAHYALWDRDPARFYRVNVEGTKHVLDAAREAGVQRIVYTSTIGAIGLPEKGGVATEETPLTPTQLAGHYKRSKFMAEQEVIRYAQRGLPVVIVNPTAPIGEYDRKPTPTGQIIVDFMKGRMWAYMDTGMNLIDVDDVALGHLSAMERGRIGERYILGNQNLTLQEIFQLLSQITGVRAPRIKLPRHFVLPLAYLDTWVANYITHRQPRIPVEGVRMAKYYMHYDCTKARRELGLPQTPIEHAMEKAVRWFRAHGYAC